MPPISPERLAVLFNPKRHWSDMPAGHLLLDGADAEADKEDSLSERYAFSLGEQFGVHRLDLGDARSSDFQSGYAHGRRRQAHQADVYVRKQLALRKHALDRRLPVSSGLTAEFLQRIAVPVCPVSGVELTRGTLTDSDWSLDRLDNNLGYVPGNVAFVSARVNRLKGTASQDQLTTVATQILLEHGPSGYVFDIGNGLATVEALRLAALAAAPSSFAQGQVRLFPPLASAPGSWVTPDTAVAAIHLRCAKSVIDFDADHLRRTWFKRLGTGLWSTSTLLVRRLGIQHRGGIHPCDSWLDPENALPLRELTEEFLTDPPQLSPAGEVAFERGEVQASLRAVKAYSRLG